MRRTRIPIVLFLLVYSLVTRATEFDGVQSITGDSATPNALTYMGNNALAVKTGKHLLNAGADGSLSYSVGIDLPPALLKPVLSVDYTSGAGQDFEVAYGWRIGGIQSVSLAKEPYFRQQSQRDGEDIFRASGVIGGILHFVDATDGKKHYVLKTTSAAPIKFVYDTSSDTWRVKQNGVVRTLQRVGYLDTWRVTLTVDQWGNRIDYSYGEKGRLKQITYGGTQRLRANVKVLFHYSPLTQLRQQYTGGYGATLEYKLEDIVIQVTNAQGAFYRVNAYQFSYTLSDERIDLLTKITKQGKTSAVSLALASFEYTAIDLGIRQIERGSYIASSSRTYMFKNGTQDPDVDSKSFQTETLADLNGDGLLDKIEQAGSTGFVLNDNLPDTPASTWCAAYMKQQDGELYYDDCETFTGPEAGIGETVTEIVSLGVTRNQSVTQLVDLDSDGKLDLIVSKGENDWRVYYGSGGIGSGNPFLNVAIEPSPWLYSQTSKAPRADMGAFAREGFKTADDVLKGLLDLNNDGWLDLYDPAAGLVYHHNGARGSGWSSTGVPVTSPFTSFSQVKYTQVKDPVEALRFASDPNHVQFNYVFDRTEQVRAFIDINGDGLADAVDASTRSWLVWYGQGDGHFASNPAVWASPFSGINIAREAYPYTRYAPASGADPEVYPGQAATVHQSLHDVDGDGLPDLVNIENGVALWYPNLGAGFQTVGVALPSFFPTDALESAVTDSSAGVPVHPTDDMNIASSKWVSRMIRDWDGDGRLDYSEDFNSHHITFAESDRPFYLLGVDNNKGLVTSVSYNSSHTTYPVGQHGLGFSEFHTFGAHRPLVKKVYTLDSLTGELASAEYDYADGKMVGGVFAGFADQTVSHALNGTLMATVDSSYMLETDFPPALVSASIRRDTNRCYAPGLGGAECTPGFAEAQHTLNSYIVGGTYNHLRLLIQTQVTQLGEGPPNDIKRNIYSYYYDSDGLLTTATFNPDVFGESGEVKQTRLTYAKDSNGDIVQLATVEISASGSVLSYSEFAYDDQPLGFLTNGFMTESRQCLSPVYDLGESCAEFAITTRTAANRGQLQRITTPTGSYKDISWGYNGAIPVAVSNNYGHTRRYTINDKGRVTKVLDASGVAKKQVYDELGRVLEVKVKAKNSSNFLKTKGYIYHTDSLPHYVKTESYDGLGLVPTDSYQDFDGSGNTMRTWTRKATAGKCYFRQDFLYDLAGNLKQSSHSSGDDCTHNPTAALDFSQVLFKGYYDAFGTLREKYDDYANGLGQVLVNIPQAWQTLRTDAQGYQKHTTYNAIGKIASVQEGKHDAPIVEVANYTYDALGRIIRINLPNNNHYDYRYDTAGRLLEVRKGATGYDYNWMTYTYTGPRLTRMTDSTGQYKEYTDYDAIDRLKEYQVSDPYGKGGMLTYRTKYEGINEEGINLIETIDPFGSETFTYDRFNNIASATRSWNTSPAIADKTFSYAYDIQSRITHTTYPSGIEVQHTYLHDFETTKLITHPAGSGPYVPQPYTIEKQQASDQPVLATVSIPVFELTVNFFRQPSPIRISQHVFDFNGVVSTRDYRYGLNGQIDQIHYDNQAASQITVDFTYDHLQRLVSQAKDGVSELAYTYLNNAGDIDTVTALTPLAGTYTYSYHDTASTAYKKGLRRPKSREISLGIMGISREDFSYDGFGRMARWDRANGRQRSFTYDGVSRLRGVVLDGQLKHANKYDFDGNLIETAVLDGGSQPIRRYKAFRSDATVSPVKETEKISNVLLVDVSDPQNHLLQVLLKELHGDVSKWYDRMPQQQGDAAGRRRLNMAGETIWEDGEPYGDESFQGAPFIDSPHGVDLFHMGARHLARRDGMWLQPEPLLYLGPDSLLADPKGLNPYRYAKNNPVNFTDPDGFGTVKLDVANQASRHADFGLGWVSFKTDPQPSDEIIDELVNEVTGVAPEVLGYAENIAEYARLIADLLEANEKYAAGLHEEAPFPMTEGLAESLISIHNSKTIQSAPRIAEGARESALVLADALLQGPRNGTLLPEALPNEVAARLLQHMAGFTPGPGPGGGTGAGAGPGGGGSGGMGALFYGAMATTGAAVMGGAYLFSGQTSGVGMVPAYAAPNPRVGIAGMQRMPGEQATVLEGGPMMGGGGGFGPVGKQAVKESGNW